MTSTRRVVLAIVAVVALASIGGSAATAGAEFQNSPYETTQDGTAVIPVDLNDTASVRLQVGSKSSGYMLNATLVDNDDDGAVAVEFHVPNAGTDDPTVSAVGQDSVEDVSEYELHDPPLASGAYRLTVSGDGEQVSDVSRLQVDEAGESATTEAATTTAQQTTENPTTTAPETSTTAAATTEDSSSGGAPGFGISVALAGVLGAALLAARP
jgi:PGF-CTERM protein